MKKFIPYIIAGVVIIGGLITYIITREPNTTDTNNNSNNSKSVLVLDFNQPLCEQIPSSTIAEAIDQQITKTTPITSSTSNVCQYYVDDTNFVTLRLNILDYENKKKGQTALDRTITTNNQIQTEHFVAVQENGLINDITIKLDDGMFLAVDRSSTKAANEEQIIALAAKVAEYIKNIDATTNTQSNSDDAVVPEPQEQDIVRNFFQLINEGNVSEAVLAMSSKNTSDDSTKQAWGVQFNDWNSVTVSSIDTSMPDSWSDSRHTYKVVMDMVIDPSAADAPIPYYGYENGKNIRFISIVKENELWKIDEIATGP
jgi:hypothetical protein